MVDNRQEKDPRSRRVSSIFQVHVPRFDCLLFRVDDGIVQIDFHLIFISNAYFIRILVFFLVDRWRRRRRHRRRVAGRNRSKAAEAFLSRRHWRHFSLFFFLKCVKRVKRIKSAAIVFEGGNVKKSFRSAPAWAHARSLARFLLKIHL